jgi:hypothetical protein
MSTIIRYCRSEKKQNKNKTTTMGPLLSASLLQPLHPELKQSFLFVTIKLSLGFDPSIVSCQLSMSWTA